VDIGCGHGLALAAFARADPALSLRGLDESPAAIARARSRGLSVERLDVQELDEAGAARISDAFSGFDLALCLEVAEHLPAWHSGKLLTIVTGPRRLVFSAAQLNQGGRLHVNEQPGQYWIDRLAARGCHLSAGDEGFRRAIAALDLPWWYGQNVHLFERDAARPR
jgi:SAM-dependent methyltransferase